MPGYSLTRPKTPQCIVPPRFLENGRIKRLKLNLRNVMNALGSGELLRIGCQHSTLLSWVHEHALLAAKSDGPSNAPPRRKPPNTLEESATVPTGSSCFRHLKGLKKLLALVSARLCLQLPVLLLQLEK